MKMKLSLALALVVLIMCSSCKMLIIDSGSSQSESVFETRLNAMLGEWDFEENEHKIKLYINSNEIIIDEYGIKEYVPIKLSEIPYPDSTESNGWINRTKYILENYDKDDVVISQNGKDIDAVLVLENDTLTLDRTFDKNILWIEVFKRHSSTSSGGSSSEETVTLTGEYNITNSNQSGSSFTMSNGNWTYDYYGNIKTGTYSQNGNELTINYSKNGYSQSATFTVSKSGDIITLTDKSGETDAIKGLVFMTSELNVKLSAN